MARGIAARGFSLVLISLAFGLAAASPAQAQRVVRVESAGGAPAKAATCSGTPDYCKANGNVSIQLTQTGSGSCSWTTVINWGDNHSDTKNWSGSTTFSHHYDTVGTFHGKSHGSGRSSDPNTTCTAPSFSFTVKVPEDHSFTQADGCDVPPCTRITQSRKAELVRERQLLTDLANKATEEAWKGGGVAFASGLVTPLQPEFAILAVAGGSYGLANTKGAIDARKALAELQKTLDSSVVVPDGSPNAIGPKGNIKGGGQKALMGLPSATAAAKGHTGHKAGRVLKALTRNVSAVNSVSLKLSTALKHAQAHVRGGNVAAYLTNVSGAKKRARQLHKLLLKQIHLRHRTASALKALRLPHLSRSKARSLVHHAAHGSLPRKLRKLLRKGGVSPKAFARLVAHAPPKQLTAPPARTIDSKSTIALLRKQAKQASALAG